MKSSRQELKVEGAVELDHVVAYLEQLTQALKSGSVRVHRGEEELVLGPRGVVGFSLTAADKGKRQRLSLELTWRKFSAPPAALERTIGPGPQAAEATADAADAPATDGGAGDAELGGEGG